MNNVYPNLERELNRRGITLGELATATGLSPGSLRRRINGTTEWKLHEVARICFFLDHGDASELFLRLDIIS